MATKGSTKGFAATKEMDQEMLSEMATKKVNGPMPRVSITDDRNRTDNPKTLDNFGKK
jgi:hypothetical protein